jgi:DNA-binding MarR family transcriptional regulator
MNVKSHKYPFAKKWAAELVSDGHVQISTFFLENYHRLKPYPLTHGEAMFVVHLMQYKWTEEAPYPGYKTIARRMGVSDKTARRLAKSLEDKKYLFREIRQATTNRFHLTKLMSALVVLKNALMPAKPPNNRKKGS